MGITCQNIADYFLAVGNECGEVITNLKLQKLVYYAQAWHLANFHKSLFNEDFQAWVHGPVVVDLYNTYKSFGSGPIIFDVKLSDVCENFDENLLGFLEEITKVYMPLGAFELEAMTHLEDPWLITRGDRSPEELCTDVIKKDLIEEYYGKRISS